MSSQVKHFFPQHLQENSFYKSFLQIDFTNYQNEKKNATNNNIYIDIYIIIYTTYINLPVLEYLYKTKKKMITENYKN